MQHPDEGTIHSWLDGALSADEAANVEAHVKECPQCGAAVAEARGFIAGASRILTALDNAPRGVIPAAAPKKDIDPMMWRVAATVLVVAAGTLVVVRNHGSNEQPMSVAADPVTLVEKRASLPERVPAAIRPAQIVADAFTPKTVAVNAPTIALTRKTVARDSISGIPVRENNAAAKAGVMMRAGQSVAGSGNAEARAPAASTVVPAHVAGGLVALDAAGESGLLKVVGTPRRIGAKVTLYEVAPGDTVTLTEAMPISLNEVVVTSAAAAPMAAQATGKSAVSQSKAQADAGPITTATDTQRKAPVLSAPAASAPAPTSQPGIENTLRAISWTDPATGRTLTLTGRIPKARLQEIKIRVERERATAAAGKKNP